MGWRVQALPFLDESVLQDQFTITDKSALSAFRSLNDTVVSIFQCPSTARFPRTIEIESSLDNSARADGLVLGSKDYAATFLVAVRDHDKEGVKGAEMESFKGAWCRRKGAYMQRNSLEFIRDGFSTTMLLTERAGVPDFYIGRPSASPDGPQSARIPTDDPEYYSPSNTASRNFGAIWPSVDNWYHIHVRGEQPLPEFSGLAVNKRNDLGIYAFHSGGAYASYCDGHVNLIATETDPEVVLAQFTAAGGERAP